jgi:hypothetical protein
VFNIPANSTNPASEGGWYGEFFLTTHLLSNSALSSGPVIFERPTTVPPFPPRRLRIPGAITLGGSTDLLIPSRAEHMAGPADNLMVPRTALDGLSRVVTIPALVEPEACIRAFDHSGNTVRARLQHLSSARWYLRRLLFSLVPPMGFLACRISVVQLTRTGVPTRRRLLPGTAGRGSRADRHNLSCGRRTGAERSPVRHQPPPLFHQVAALIGSLSLVAQ